MLRMSFSVNFKCRIVQSMHVSISVIRYQFSRQVLPLSLFPLFPFFSKQIETDQFFWYGRWNYAANIYTMFHYNFQSLKQIPHYFTYFLVLVKHKCQDWTVIHSWNLACFLKPVHQLPFQYFIWWWRLCIPYSLYFLLPISLSLWKSVWSLTCWNAKIELFTFSTLEKQIESCSAS